TSIASRAGDLFGEAFRKSLIRGSTLLAMATGALYCAAREQSLGVTIEEVKAHSVVSKRQISHAIRKTERELHLALPGLNPKDHIPRILDFVGIPQNGAIANIAFRILEQCDD